MTKKGWQCCYSKLRPNHIVIVADNEEIAWAVLAESYPAEQPVRGRNARDTWVIEGGRGFAHRPLRPARLLDRAAGDKLHAIRLYMQRPAAT